MNKRILATLLGISLAFNLAVAGSLIWLRITRPPRPPMEHFRSRNNALPAHIDPGWHNPEIINARNQFTRCKLELMQVLQQEPLDEARALAIIDSSLQNQNRLERQLGERLLNIRKQMTAEEADQYFGAHVRNMQNMQRNIRHHRRTNEKDITD